MAVDESTQKVSCPCRSYDKIYKHASSLRRHQAGCGSRSSVLATTTEAKTIKPNCPTSGRYFISCPGFDRHRKVCSNRDAPSSSGNTTTYPRKVCERVFDSFQEGRQHERRAHPSFIMAGHRVSSQQSSQQSAKHVRNRSHEFDRLFRLYQH